MTIENSIIRASGLSKSYESLTVLHDVSLEVQSKELLTITGPSGAGKSTLLHILGTLDKPDAGELYINNASIYAMKEKRLAAFRNSEIGFVFQFHQLLPEFTALENVAIPSYIANKRKSEAEKRAKELLSFLDLTNRMNHKPGELSGGEQQRVAVARALMNKPKIIFADEPSGNLDRKNAEELHTLFYKLKTEFDQTFVVVTHNPSLADYADREIKMVDGHIV